MATFTDFVTKITASWLNRIDTAIAAAGTWVIDKASGSGIKVDTTTPTFPWRDLEGLVYPDLQGANAPTLAAFIGGSVRRYAFSATDKADCEFHIPHDYVPGTDLYLHAHWAHNGTAISGQIQMTFAYTYAKGHNQANFSTEKSQTLTVTTPDITTIPRYRHRIDEILITNTGGTSNYIDNAIIEPDGVLGVNFTMTTIPTITGGSPNEPFVFMIDLHYQSTNIGTKNKINNFYS